LKVFRFAFDPRDALGTKRIILNEESLWKCVFCESCNNVCPKNLKHSLRFEKMREWDSKNAKSEYAKKAVAHALATVRSIARTGRADEVEIFTSTGLAEAAIDALPKLLRGGWKRKPYRPRPGETDRRIVEAFRAVVSDLLQ